MTDYSSGQVVARTGPDRSPGRAWHQHRRRGERFHLPRLLGLMLALNAGIIGTLLIAGGTARLGFTPIHGVLLGAVELALILFLARSGN